MADVELTIEQLVTLIKQLPLEDKYALLSALQEELCPPCPDGETKMWLDSDLTNELPPYEWNVAEIPVGKSICYLPGFGFTVMGGK